MTQEPDFIPAQQSDPDFIPAHQSPDYSHPTPEMLQQAGNRSKSITNFELQNMQLPDAASVATNYFKGKFTDLANAASGAYHAVTDKAQTPLEAQIAPTSTSRIGQLLDPQAQALLAIKRMGQGYYQGQQAAYNTAQTTKDPREKAIENMAFYTGTGPLVHGVYAANRDMPAGYGVGVGESRILQALLAAPEGSVLANPVRGLSGLPEALQTRLRGTVTQNPTPTLNLAAAATEGGAPRGGVAVTDIASPELTQRMQQNYAKGGYTDYSPDTFRKVARDTVGDVDTEMKRYTAPVQGRVVDPATRQTIVQELRSQAAATNIQSRANALNSWAARIESARTGGELLKVKSDAFSDAARSSFGDVTADAGADAAYDVGSSIVKNYYPEISRVVGKDIGPIGKLEQQAVQMQTQAERAYPKLQASDAKAQTQTFGSRVRAGETVTEMTKNAVGAGKPTNVELFQNRFKAAMQGAQPGTPPVQGPLQPAPGKYGPGPQDAPNAGQGPLSPAGSTGPQQPSNFGRPDPGVGPLNPAGSLVPDTSFGGTSPGTGPIRPAGSLGPSVREMKLGPNPGSPAPTTAQPDTGPSLQKFNPYSNPSGKQGGHAGGVAASVEETARPGDNVMVSNGQSTFHGKSFAPESTPANGLHFTDLKNGTYRVNGGVLTPQNLQAVKNYFRERYGISNPTQIH